MKKKKKLEAPSFEGTLSRLCKQHYMCHYVHVARMEVSLSSLPLVTVCLSALTHTLLNWICSWCPAKGIPPQRDEHEVAVQYVTLPHAVLIQTFHCDWKQVFSLFLADVSTGSS